MDRADSLAFLITAGFAKLIRAAGRTETDSDDGYGPALDEAFSYYAVLYPGSTVVVPEHELGFRYLLRATTLDLLQPTLCSYVDTQVDAPLTKVSGSQLCKQVMALQARAWNQAAGYGYGGMTEVGGFAANLDYNEVDRFVLVGE